MTGLLYAAAGDGLDAVLLLGHGAGAGQTSPFMVAFARGLSSRGIDVATFHFPYMERGRGYPDRGDKLEECYRAAMKAVLDRIGTGRRLLIGGKSLGGRIASQVVAAGGGLADDVAGIVLLGYPLHPPGKPERRRSKHLSGIVVPMLFCQGSRDAFGTPEELRQAVDGLGEGSARAKLYVVDGGDHSFTVPRRWPVSGREVLDSVMDEIAAWVAAVPPQAA